LKKGGNNWNFKTLIIRMGVYERGGVQMPTYMTLIKYTQKGVENMKDGPGPHCMDSLSRELSSKSAG